MPRNPLKAVVDVGPYQFFMLALCVWALAVLGAETFIHLDEDTRTILQYADNIVCALFLLDFIYNLVTAPNRTRYLLTWGWIDLLSSIPMIDAFRLGRAARLLRIVRVLRAMRSARAIAQFVMAKRTESAGLAVGSICLLLIVFSSMSVLEFEVPANGNIQSAEDALWWSVTTMTTVGYGDRYPTTSEGRMIAVVLMAAGVGLFGTLSGLVASWLVSPRAKEADKELEQVRLLLIEVRELLVQSRIAGQRDGQAG